jgi:hypothetical protein
MSRIAKWKLEKTKVKVIFRLQFHATHVSKISATAKHFHELDDLAFFFFGTCLFFQYEMKFLVGLCDWYWI